jgi:hypothetical protein
LLDVVVFVVAVVAVDVVDVVCCLYDGMMMA